MSSALVLAGGGVAGIAWETGVLLGVREVGVTVSPDLVVGTSAGSAVGAQVLSGLDLEELYARQIADEHQELTPELDLERLIALYSDIGDLTGGLSMELRIKVGAVAQEATTVPLAARRAVISWRLPTHTWPATDLRITAVDANTGELVVLDRNSGVDLVDAVMASCAVPAVWPPVPLLGRVLVDGGMRSLTNLDLAAGYDDVLVLVPMAGPALTRVTDDADALRAAGATVTVIAADEQAAAVMAANPLDPALRRPAAEQGRRQGRLGLPA
jgi:NTE family protein